MAQDATYQFEGGIHHEGEKANGDLIRNGHDDSLFRDGCFWPISQRR